ncbi:MAG: hypothetical protein BWX72_01071 [Firmicutes bacterium ADurb.Bin080]|nr:MAG: hypothetical protein BWX72_01071 [Firmicutes bacterium ADurb.Bin080]
MLASEPMNIFWNFGFASGTRKAARKKGMYVVTNTGIAPHQGYTQMKAGEAAKNISITLNNRALAIANTILLLIPKIFFLGSSGRSLLIMSPATENIIESSQLTPISKMNDVLSGDTVQRA